MKVDIFWQSQSSSTYLLYSDITIGPPIGKSDHVTITFEMDVNNIQAEEELPTCIFMTDIRGVRCSYRKPRFHYRLRQIDSHCIRHHDRSGSHDATIP